MYRPVRCRREPINLAVEAHCIPSHIVPPAHRVLLCNHRESIRLLREEGFENVVARHHRLAEGAREAVKVP